MTISANELQAARAETVRVSGELLRVSLADGRTIVAPLAWFPRLVHATPEERGNWRLIGRGKGIHWDDLDEDISVEGLLAGRASGESQESLKAWLHGRSARPPRRTKRPG